MGKNYNHPHFFILSKGNNSGKPLEAPCPNCFVCICTSVDEKQKLYWVFYGLWQGMFFHPFITGSVIPFIRLSDLINVAVLALSKIEALPDKYAKNLIILQSLDKHANLIHQQIAIIKQAKKALMYEVLK